MRSRVVRNIGWNGLFLIAQTVVSLLSVPLLLKATGDQGFGLYSFFLGLVGMAALLQAGIDLAMSRSVAQFRGEANEERLRADLSFGYLFCTVSGMLQAVLVLVLVRIPGVIGPEDLGLAEKLSIVFAASALLNGPLSVSVSVLIGFERFLFRNLVSLVPTSVGLIVAFSMTPDRTPRQILIYVVAVEATKVLAGVVALVKSERIYAHLANLRWQGLLRRDVMAFQAKQAGNQVADFLFNTSDRLILQSILGAAAVAQYAIADRPNVLAHAIVSAPLIALVPSLAKAVASADASYIYRVMTIGTRVYCSLTLPFLVTLLLFAPALIVLWVGPGYAISARAAQFFVLCLVVTAPFKIYSHYRLAEGSVGAMAITKLAFAPVNALTSFYLCHQIGLLGVVLPTAFFYVVIYPSVWLISIVRRGETRIFIRSTGMPAMATLASVAICWVLVEALPSQTPTQVVLSATASVIVSLIVFGTAGGGLAAARKVNAVKVADPQHVSIGNGVRTSSSSS